MKTIEFKDLTISEYIARLKNKEFTATQAVDYFKNRIAQDKHNAVLEFFASAYDLAKAVDKKLANNEKVGALAGVPVIIKDNMLYTGHKASAGSKMLENFVAPYTATVVKKLLDADAVILGRANMDEFAMGTTGATSAYGVTLNALNDKCISGGSSSGSACAVAAGLCLASLGSDTGGSVRLPAVNNGLCAVKPTYGTASRYGVIAFSSGLDQVGAIAKNCADTELVQNIISGKDGHDTTMLDAPVNATKFDIKTLRIGYLKEVKNYQSIIEDYDKHIALLDFFKSHGASVTEISLPEIDLCLPCYHIISTAEAASNFARFDGVKYTSSANADDLDSLYVQTRTKCFGAEVKRRIMLGNFVLSSGFHDAYYNKAKSLQASVRNRFSEAFKKVDCVIMPVSLTDADEVNKKSANPTESYLLDLFSVAANIAGVPSVAVPFEKGKKGLPIGFQIMGKHFSEPLLYSIAKFFEENGGKKC